MTFSPESFGIKTENVSCIVVDESPTTMHVHIEYKDGTAKTWHYKAIQDNTIKRWVKDN